MTTTLTCALLLCLRTVAVTRVRTVRCRFKFHIKPALCYIALGLSQAQVSLVLRSGTTMSNAVDVLLLEEQLGGIALLYHVHVHVPRKPVHV